MPRVQVKEHALWVDDQRVPFVAGEVHYWRLSPQRWPEILAQVRRTGLRMVATYVPWHYHELEPGHFDFDGTTEPQRDLAGFLDLLTREQFWIFIRPGPYIYAEWTNAGVPDRVVSLPRIGEEYRREARVWMEAVTDVLRPRLATNGGRIVLLQPDNEFDLFSHWFEDACGLDGTQAGFFQQFLASVYPDVAALNDAWGTGYASFDQATPLAARTDSRDPHALTRHKDYWRFQHWATVEGYRWHADVYRELGVGVPLVGNYYPGGDVQNWREVGKVFDFCGIDWYPKADFGGEAARQRQFLDTCRYQRTVSPLPSIVEFESGVWHGFHEYIGIMKPSQFRLLAMSALAAGIQGFNWYMLVGRDNWYYTPINERGQARGELTHELREIHRIFDKIDPPTLAKCAQTCALFEPLQVGTDNIFRANPVLDALHAADVDFELFDPEIGVIERPLMFYAASDWLARASQERLRAYVETGGTLVMFQNYPRRDENFRPHNGLDIVEPDRVLSPLGKKLRIAFGTQHATMEGAVWHWDRPPGEPLAGEQVIGAQQAVENAEQWMLKAVGRKLICGYHQELGRGRLVVMGMPPSPAAIRAIHRWLGVPLYAQAELPRVQTALFERGGEHFLLATNMNDADVQTRVTLDGVNLPEMVRIHDYYAQSERAMPRDALTITIPRHSGGAWRISG